MTTWDSATAWRELLDGLRDLDATFLEGPKAVRGEQAVVEGYRFLATVLGVAFDISLFGDTTAPRFVDVNTPHRPDRRWGGDNTDAYYCFAPVDPARTYEVRGQRGDSCYFSLTCYNEPSPGQWSNRVVGIVNDSDLTCDAEGRFSFLIGPVRPADYDGPFIELADDAAALLTRDYQLHPGSGQRVTWEISVVGDAPSPTATDQATARSLRTALRWVQEMFAIVPLTVEPRQDQTALGHNAPVGANTFALPYQVGDFTYGWSARDACYGFGSFSLQTDEALVVTHTPPDCRFWNLTIWNQYMACHDIDHARVSVNMGSAVPNSDGTVTIVIAHTELEHPNAISTASHDEGVVAFRWFHAAAVPGQPVASVVKAHEAPKGTT